MNERTKTGYKIITAERSFVGSNDNTSSTHALRLKLIELGLSFNGLTKVEDGKRFQCFLVNGDCPEIPGAYEVKGSFYLSSKNNATGKESYLTFYEDGQEYFLNIKGEVNANAAS